MHLLITNHAFFLHAVVLLAFRTFQESIDTAQNPLLYTIYRPSIDDDICLHLTSSRAPHKRYIINGYHRIWITSTTPPSNPIIAICSCDPITNTIFFDPKQTYEK